MKRILFIAAVLGIIGSVLWFNRGYLRPYFNHGQPIPLPPAEQYQNTESTSSAQFGASSTPPDLFPLEVSSKKSTTTKPLSSTTTKPLPVSAVDPFAWNGPLPSEKNLAVPFLSQAPKQNWNLPYQEACEETAAIMVDAYYKGQTQPFTPEAGDKEILDVIAFEKSLLGKYEDTTAAETAQFIKGFFGYKTVVIKAITDMTDLKKAIANGYPVMVPSAGKLLDNPNFRNGGPLYHMLVVKGWTKDGHWITNDPGTRNGSNFLYTNDNLSHAMHDWNGGDVVHGTPVAIVIIPNKN